MPGRTILPWDKDDLTLLAEEFGIQLIKMDLLGLGMLSAVGRCFEYVQQRTGETLRLHGFRYDPRAFDVLCEADTVGLFQVESRAQQSFLPRLQPKTLSDVAISVGAIRPGPGAARAGEHIVRRRQGKEAITYPAPELKPALEETYGVLLWQEQCIQVAVIAAGYTPGEADQLRRAMSHKRSYERMEELTRDLVERMLARGYAPRTAEAVRTMIVGYAGYGFPRAHAYPFAHVALISATLRLRYPAMYYAAMLNCQPMGFYAPHTLVWDAHRHGVRVLPIDVNRSAWECTLESIGVPPSETLAGASGTNHAAEMAQPAIRLGFKEVHGLGTAAREVLERERQRGPFVHVNVNL
jgi:error-prone DNA polymerase